MVALLAEIEREVVRQAGTVVGGAGTTVAATAGKGVGVVGNAGKGLSLGLGLGLGAWGPVLVIAAAAAAGYAYLEYRRRQLGSDEEIEQSGETDEGFYPTQG